MGLGKCVVWLAVQTVCTLSITTAQNTTTSQCKEAEQCVRGLFLPVWMPQENISAGEKVPRAMVYLAGLLYMFLGVSIIADRFMAAIEVITSKEKTVIVKKITGQEYRILVRVWNETVSNLTLMALGSSAPEILLSIIEIVGNNFEAGQLGPGTIVGSAAFNMFIIIGICIISIPDGQSRHINHIYVFWVTLVWSIFAYIWLYLILAVISPNVVDLWEGLITFSFFPLTVLTAYVADRKMFGILGKRFSSRKTTTSFLMRAKTGGAESECASVTADIKQSTSPTSVEAVEFENHRKDFIHIFKRMREEHPDTPIDVLEQMAEQEVLMNGPKSRAFYRIQATRKLIGSGDVVAKRYHQMEESKSKKIQDSKVPKDYGIIKVFLDPGHYTCLENVGTCYVTVKLDRNGVETPCTVMVDYKTADGSATSYKDFTPVEGTLSFNQNEDSQRIGIGIVDNDVYEEDEFFYVKLIRVRAAGKNGQRVPVKLVTPMNATVMIIDNDHAGAFGFENEVYDVSEAAEHATIKVIRSRGARGAVRVPYKTVDGTAKADKDYKPVEGILYFKDEQSVAEIDVEIMNDDQYEKKEDFTIELGHPVWSGHEEDSRSVTSTNSKSSTPKMKRKDTGNLTEEEIAKLGKPILSDIARCKIIIQESKEFKGFVDKLLMSANTSILVGTDSWKQQFREAWSAQGSEEDHPPGCCGYFMHALTLPWKLLFAFVPPTAYVGGWLCFIVSISVIGLMTAFIGDLASHFGCTVGMKDAVTAISLVALGTSVPDTFASKVAAVQDAHADSSIGNVTGSNAVNVYLGIGVAWALAAIYHKVHGTTFKVEAGSLAFSVTCFCIGAAICTVMLQIRRYRFGGELGGGQKSKYIFGMLFFLIWIMYLVLSSLQIYCIIDPF